MVRTRRFVALACLSLLAAAAALIDVNVFPPRVAVRWAEGIDAADRAARERQYELSNGEQDGDSSQTWRYELGTADRDTIAALVRDPAVADTAGIDRSTFTSEPRRIEWRVRRGPLPLLAEYAGRVRALPPTSKWLIGCLALAAGLTTWAWRRRKRDPGPWVGRAALVTASLVFAAAFCWPLLEGLGAAGGRHDWDQHMLYHWVPFETVRRFGEVPLWNPYLCGGMPMLGNPQSRWYSPFFLLHLVVGPELGVQLEVIAHIALAWLGAFVLARTIGLSRVASLVPAVVFAGSSAFYLHIGEGHTTWLPFAYVPWTLAAALARRPFVAGALLALSIGEGGVHPAPYAALALVALAIHRSVVERSARPLGDLALTAMMAFCLAAPKLLLAHELMTSYPRFTQSSETMTFGQLAEALFSRSQDLDYTPAGQPYAFHEYGAYVGPIAAVLAVAGLWTRRRTAVPWLLLALTGIALAAGPILGGELSPWALLHQLPLFASLRVPSRFLLLTVLAVGVLAGLGMEAFTRSGQRRLAVAAVLLLAAAIDAAAVGPHNLRYALQRPSDPLPTQAVFVQFRDEADTRMYQLARANMGALTCYEPLKPVTSVLARNDAGYRGEQYLLNGGSVTLVEWTPHRLVFDVVAAQPDVLVVNQNHHPSWRIEEGYGTIAAQNGLLAVRVTPGAQRVALEYESARFTIGLALAGLGTVAAAVTAVRKRRRMRADRSIREPPSASV
jgi:hypothetical protein